MPSVFPQYVARRCKKTFADTYSSGSKLTALELDPRSEQADLAGSAAGVQYSSELRSETAGRAQLAEEGVDNSRREWGNGADQATGGPSGAGPERGNGGFPAERRGEGEEPFLLRNLGTSEGTGDGEQPMMRCPVVGCGVLLTGVAEYEAHYSSKHQLACSVCGRGFPSDRFLTLHLAEAHDSFFQARAARGLPVFECLVETCSERFHTDTERLQHLVQRHHFPPTFRFHGSAPARPRTNAHQTPKPRGKAGPHAQQAQRAQRGQTAQRGTEGASPSCDMDMEVPEAPASRPLGTVQRPPERQGIGGTHMPASGLDREGEAPPGGPASVQSPGVHQDFRPAAQRRGSSRGSARVEGGVGEDKGADAMVQDHEQVAQLEGALSKLSVSRAFVPRQVSMSRALQEKGKRGGFGP